MQIRGAALVALGLLLVGCSDDNNGKTAGTEGGPCYPNGTCNAGLTCLSEVCVRLPDAAVPDQGSTDAAPDVQSPEASAPDQIVGDIPADVGTADADAADVSGQDSAGESVPFTDGNSQDGTFPLAVGSVAYQNVGDQLNAVFSAGEEYLVAVYSTSTVATSSISYTLGVGSAPPIQAPPSPPVQQAFSPDTWTRTLAEKASQMSVPATILPAQPIPRAACTLSSDCSATEVCHLGQCVSSVTVNVSSFSATATVNVEVKKKGTVAAVLVDTSDTVASAMVDAIHSGFEQNIYPREVALFGNPPLKTGVAQLSSDRNGDGLVWIVLTSRVAEKSAHGFFVATDFDDTDPKSNKADILYLDAGLLNTGNAMRVMAHHFQHLLGFATKVYRAKVNGGVGALEALWLDEGQSYFAEDACGFGGENTTLLDQETFTSFDTTSLVDLQDSLAMRGMALTFVRHLFEQKGGVSYNANGTITDAGGAAWLKQLHLSSKTGADAIDQTYGNFKDAFDQWIGAIALDGRGLTTKPQHSFQPLATDPVTGWKVGIKIRGARLDETGAQVTLQGPLETPLSGTTTGSIPNATGKFYVLKGYTGTVPISLTSSDNTLRYMVARTK